MKIQLFLKISVLKKICKFRWKTPALQALRKRPQHKCFPVNVLGTPFSTEQLQWLLFKTRNSNNLWIAIQTCFSDISYAQPISDDLQFSHWETYLKKQWLTKNLFRYCIFVADLEQTPFDINNFAVLLHFWKT